MPPLPRWLWSTVFLSMLSVLVACGGSSGENNAPNGLAACGSSPFLTVPPADPSQVESISPLGVVEPSGHVFPSDHIYLYPAADPGGGRVLGQVRAPGLMVIVGVVRQVRTGGGQPVVEDYAVTFFPCADVKMYFGHIVSLTSDLTARIGALDRCDPPFVLGGFTYTRCEKTVEISLDAGTLIGTFGGTTGFTLDYGGYDRRVPEATFVNPARSYGSGQEFGQNRTICPLDYFVPAVASGLKAKLGGNGKLRTIPPVCGTIMQDLADTPQGRWYFDATTQEDHHLALIHNNIDPTRGTISVGTSIPSLPTAELGFEPAAAGRVNRDFPGVSADGLIYCYQTFAPQPPPPFRHVLIQLIGPTTLRVEGVLGSLCGDPSSWTFTAAARSFAR